MLRILTTVAALLAFGTALFAFHQRGQACDLAPQYQSIVRALQGAGGPQWKDAEKGDLKGTVRFNGKRPSQPMVIYLVREGEQGTFETPADLEISQKGAVFNPAFAVLVAGQKVKFKNDEDKAIDHNVYFLGASNIDLEIIAPGKDKSHRFDLAGEVSFHCSIHKFMDGKFFVAPSPAFVLVEGDATAYNIKGIPVGKYSLKSWQKSKRFKDVEQAVEITGGKEAISDVEMTR